MFAPVYFRAGVYLRPGFRYVPSVVVRLGHLMMHLFVQPRYHHYFWGDYYADRYRDGGFRPWFDLQGRYGYDPLFAYYRVYFRHRDIDYGERLHGWYDHFRHHEGRRPPITLAAQARFAARAKSDGNLQYSLLGDTVASLLTDGGAAARLRPVPQEQRRLLGQAADQLLGVSKDRAKAESQVPRPSLPSKGEGGRNAPGKPGARWALPATPQFPRTHGVNRLPLETPRGPGLQRGPDRQPSTHRLPWPGPDPNQIPDPARPAVPRFLRDGGPDSPGPKTPAAEFPRAKPRGPGFRGPDAGGQSRDLPPGFNRGKAPRGHGAADEGSHHGPPGAAGPKKGRH